MLEKGKDASPPTKRSPRRPERSYRKTPGLAVRRSRIHGFGCFAAQPFKKGKKIAEYFGERVRFADLTAEDAPPDLNYLISVDEVWAVDGSRNGNETQFINHSCEANVYLRITRGHALFYALRDIEPGEELTWRYVITYADGESMPCYCEAARAK